MPILAAEIDMHPEGFLDRPGIGQEDKARWWALYTLSRREKELMRRLRSLDIAFYSPLIPRRSNSPSGRPRVAHVPLFSSYVFVHGEDGERYRAMTTNCVSRWLPIPDGEKLTQDLRQIRRLIASAAPLTPEARLLPGTRVRVRSGPLAGIEGEIVSRRGQTRLVVAVNFLRQGASLLLEDYQVERLY
jgi:transcription antitermination factor NusG